MKKFNATDFYRERKRTGSIMHMIDYLRESDRLIVSVDADDYIYKQSKKYRFVGKDDLPSKYFAQLQMKEGDSDILMFERDDHFILLSEQGEVAKLLYREGKRTIFFQEKDPEQAHAYLVRCIQKEQQRLLAEDPEHVVKEDLRRRSEKQKRGLQQRIEALKQDAELPDNFDEMLDHVYAWANNFEEFTEVLASGDARAFGCRPLERVQRATVALYEPNAKNDEDIVIYRALPNGCVIEEGDWVSVDESYASFHEVNSSNAITVSEVVRADEVYDTSSVGEQIYVPRGTWGDATCLKDVWESLNTENKPDAAEAIKPRTYEEIKAEKAGLSPSI